MVSEGPGDGVTATEAREWISEVCTEGVDRSKFVGRVPRGEMAKRYWDDPMFSYGVEYGVLMALVKVFDLDLECGEDD